MHAAGIRCRLRPMRSEDIPAVVEIERQSFPSMWPQTVYKRELKNKLARYVVAYEPAGAEKLVDDPPAPATAGVIGLLQRVFGNPPSGPRDRILGMAGLWCMVGEGHIVTIAVHEVFRRQGIGEVLLVAILEAALDAGQDEVTLEYRVSNGAARALYEKYGFSQVGVRKAYYSDNGEDAVLMSTPPLRSMPFRRLLAKQIASQRERWGDDYPLGNKLRVVEGVLATG